MHVPIAPAQLLDRSYGWEDQRVRRTLSGALAVNCLRARDDEFFNWQSFLANDFEHLCRTKRVHVNEFGNLRHIPAVSRLVKNDFDIFKRGRYCGMIAQIALNEFRFFFEPGWFSAAMRLRLEIIERAHSPTFADQHVHEVRADEASGSRHQGAFCDACC